MSIISLSKHNSRSFALFLLVFIPQSHECQNAESKEYRSYDPWNIYYEHHPQVSLSVIPKKQKLIQKVQYCGIHESPIENKNKRPEQEHVMCVIFTFVGKLGKEQSNNKVTWPEYENFNRTHQLEPIGNSDKERVILCVEPPQLQHNVCLSTAIFTWAKPLANYDRKQKYKIENI